MNTGSLCLAFICGVRPDEGKRRVPVPVAGINWPTDTSSSQPIGKKEKHKNDLTHTNFFTRSRHHTTVTYMFSFGGSGLRVENTSKESSLCILYMDNIRHQFGWINPIHAGVNHLPTGAKWILLTHTKCKKYICLHMGVFFLGDPLKWRLSFWLPFKTYRTWARTRNSWVPCLGPEVIQERRAGVPQP